MDLADNLPDKANPPAGIGLHHACIFEKYEERNKTKDTLDYDV